MADQVTIITRAGSSSNVISSVGADGEVKSSVTSGSSTRSSVAGEQTFNTQVSGAVGPQGPPGNDGYTPVKGVDYDDGYTPQKGVDYFDGEDGADGYTPVKGVDYFDGTNGADGKEVELQKSSTHIQWRYEGDSTWNDLVALADLKGDKGDTGNAGADGREIELQTNSTHIQWRLGEGEWTNLVALSEITGPAGADGAGLPVGGTTGQYLIKQSNTDYDYDWETPGGGGDMQSSVYDPQNIADDAFDVDNHTDGTTNKVFTATEKSKLSNIEENADVTDATNVQAALPSGSNGQVLKHNGTSWAAGTDSNTTYSEISEANIENTSSSTVGLITGRRAEALLDNEASKSRTLSNKTLTSPVLNTGVSGTAIKDEDDMASNSATHLATQQSIKAYVDSRASASETLTNKTINGSNNTISNIGPSMRTGGFATGVITGATLGSTGNKAITGVGFTPKLVRFTVLFSANATVAAGAFGTMTSSSQYYTAWAAQPVSTAGSRNSSTTACIGWVGPSSSTPSLLASYVSMDADGFTINVSSAANNFDVAWEAYA